MDREWEMSGTDVSVCPKTELVTEMRSRRSRSLCDEIKPGICIILMLRCSSVQSCVESALHNLLFRANPLLDQSGIPAPIDSTLPSVLVE